MPDGYLQISKHTFQKYNILRKYFQACLKFEAIYGNFAYVDTHGGSGNVLFEGRQEMGSPLIAAKSEAHPQCYVVEINQERRNLLRKSVAGLKNVEIMDGDCNKKIGSILREIEPRKFTFCFIDPDGLVYEDGPPKIYQVNWTTIEEISKRSNSEILLNLRSQDILRIIGLMEKDEEKAAMLAQDITALYGSNAWSPKLGSRPNRYQVRDLFVDRFQSVGFPYVGAVNIKSDNNSHMYYLVYASHNDKGAKIMSSNFKMEWGFEPFAKIPLERFIYDDPIHAQPSQKEIQTTLI